MRVHICAWVIAVCAVAGCRSAGNGLFNGAGLWNSPSDPAATILTPSPGVLAGTVVVDLPRSRDASILIAQPSTVETWVVHTRAVEQTAASDPWESIAAGRLDETGGPLDGTKPEALLARMAGRTSIVLIHGNGYTYRHSVEEAVTVRAQLESLGGIAQDSLFIIYDWPSDRVLPGIVFDLNEKSRRSRIAGYHLARFLQAAPLDSRVCLLGHSDGGRIALSTSHLLSGAEIPPFWSESALQLTGGRPDLHLRCVLLETAAGHHWLNPGERLGHALDLPEGVLNLYNTGDLALAVYIFGAYTGLRPALGRVGLSEHDRRMIGPRAARFEQFNTNPWAGNRHTNFTEALEIPEAAERVARFTSWSDLTRARRAPANPIPANDVAW
jgi:hypothetical protein